MSQLELEYMQPCEILKDFGFILARSKSINSYLFDKYNNLCNSDSSKANWRPFELKYVAEKFLDSASLNIASNNNLAQFFTGFTVSLWFQQAVANNG